VLDTETLIAVNDNPARVDLISPTGQLLQRIITDRSRRGPLSVTPDLTGRRLQPMTTDHQWCAPLSVSVHDSGRILTVIDGYPYCDWDQEGQQCYVVCMSVSERRSLSLKWTSEPKIWARNPVITSGVVIVPCSNTFDFRCPGSTILVLSLDSGRQLMNVPIRLQLCRDFCNGICVYAERLFMGCDNPSGVVEFQLAGKLIILQWFDIEDVSVFRI
jgi:hypothetical protein